MTDAKYLDTVLNPVRVCANYRPMFGQGKGAGLSLEQFQALYQSDPFYRWFGLDNALMYAAHKAAGGMTSVYRQIGIGCERLVRQVIRDTLKLSDEDSVWSYQVPAQNGSRTLSLDARIPTASIADPDARARFSAWLKDTATRLGVDPKIAAILKGAVFEVRQGYKSKDSKRQNADIANAASAYTQRYLPCVIVLSSQIDTDITLRYRSAKWSILTGTVGGNDAFFSTYDFFSTVVGYDLAAFFTRNGNALKAEVDTALKALLTPKG